MILDIIILVIIAVAAFIGYKKGLIGILFSLIGLIVALVLALILQNTVAQTLYNTGVGESINTMISEQLTNVIEAQIKNQSEKDNNIDFYGIIVDKVADAEQISNVSVKVTMMVLKGISFVLVFFVVLLISYILQMILNVVFDLPILNSVNNVGGVIAGIFKALIKIYVILAIIYFLETTSFVTPITDMIEDSMVTKWLYNNNVFVNIIRGGLK